MKKITIIFSLILIVIFSTGGFLVHTYYLNSYRKEFKLYISQNKKTTAITIIQINPSELFINSKSIAWEDENKEIIYKGILYDIIHIENKNGKVILTAVSDFQEEELKKQFASIYDVNSSSSAKNPFELLKQFLSLKSIIHSQNNTITLFPITNFLFKKKSSFRLSTIVLSQETPPPDIII